MTKTTGLFVGIAAGVALMFAAAGASAATISFYDTGTPIPDNVLNTTGGLTGGDTQVGAGAFTDAGTFVVSPNTLLTAYNITSQPVGSLSAISGGTMEIYEGGNPIADTLVDISTSTATHPFSDFSSSFILGPGTYEVVVKSLGLTSGGTGDFSTYSIGLQGSAVPEPATWAMMLVGFGGLGMVLRGMVRTNRELAALRA